MKFVISDLHLNHGNIIDKCNRPYQSTEEMNSTLIENWNSVVSDSDIVYIIGDLSMESSHDESVNWLYKLNGQKILIEGNHDKLRPEDAPIPVLESCTFRHGKFKFFVTHRPGSAPEGCWRLAGHTHNNNLRDHPFIHKDKRCVNVSVEVIDYTPLSLDKLTTLISDTSQIKRKL